MRLPQPHVHDGVTVNPVAGTNVVSLGMDLSDQRQQGCVGFAIQREDHTEDERYWMSGTKTFKETNPGLGPGEQVSSRRHPYQTFQWADYSAKPGHDYTYTVIPLYDSPRNLGEGPHASVRVQTESEDGGQHSVFFNRGAVASQEYTRRFENKAPSQLSGEKQAAAYRWLSRGLVEALLKFIGRARGAEYGLHGAMYEFWWSDVLDALKGASDRGAKVEIVYDAITSASAETNGTAIDKALIAHLCKPRTFGKIMHNKFLVLTRDGGPIAVWTGSTNISENGIFGHLNCGHIVSDAGVAGEYLKYFRQLETGVDLDSEKDWIMVNNPAPPDPWTDDLMSIFSPHRGQKVLNWYASIAGGAQEALFMTFAFGMNERFKNVYRMDDPVLRVALMEKAGSPRNLEKEKVEIDRIRRRRNVVVAIGNRILTNSFDRWLAERPGLTRGIQWVHTKFMLVDPLSDTPTTITGSANFSEDSTGTNNENMLVIRGDTRVADIYLGEFMRLHTHYAFREAVANAGAWGNADWQPAHLVPDDSWQRDYFTPGDARYLRRRYFAQSA